MDGSAPTHLDGSGVRIINVDSTEYLTVAITSDRDVTADPVSISFDYGATWHLAAHATGGVRLLVGPSGDVTLTPGVYDVRVRISDSTEIPVLSAGSLRVSP